MPHRKTTTTDLLITVLRIDHLGRDEKGRAQLAIVDATGQRFQVKPGASFASVLTAGYDLAAEDMRLTLNHAGKVIDAAWGEGL